MRRPAPFARGVANRPRSRAPAAVQSSKAFCDLSRFFRWYVAVRLALLSLFVAARVAGLLTQDNWAFLALPSCIFASLCALAATTPGVATKALDS